MPTNPSMVGVFNLIQIINIYINISALDSTVKPQQERLCAAHLLTYYKKLLDYETIRTTIRGTAAVGQAEKRVIR